MRSNSFPELHAWMSDPSVGLGAPRVVHPAGNPEDSARCFSPGLFPPGQLPLRQPILPAVPVRILELGGALLDKRAAVARLMDSPCFDNAAVRLCLGLMPPYLKEAGLATTVADSA